MDRKIAWYPNGFRPLPMPEFAPGVGVPGKPITLDQFYTEDVFHMLVPDDGLGPRSLLPLNVKAPLQHSPNVEPPALRPEDAPALKHMRPPEVTLDATPKHWAEEIDSGIVTKPAVDFDAGMIIHPDTAAKAIPPDCGSPATRADIATYQEHAARLREAQGEMSRARNAETRKAWEREADIQKRAVDQVYARVSKCLT